MQLKQLKSLAKNSPLFRMMAQPTTPDSESEVYQLQSALEDAQAEVSSLNEKLDALMQIHSSDLDFQTEILKLENEVLAHTYRADLLGSKNKNLKHLLKSAELKASEHRSFKEAALKTIAGLTALLGSE